jgi:AcrR family transcriptional regulator
MAPRTEEQYELIRQEKRELIMDTALELFAEKSYDNCSISDISKKAKISKGLMYNYFKSKEELLLAILNRGLDRIMKIFDPNKDGVLEPEELEYFLTEMFSVLKKERHLWKLYFQVSLQPSVFKFIENRIEEMYSSLFEMINIYFENLGFENPQMEMLLFGFMLDGIALDYVMKPEMVPIDDIKNELIKRYCRKQSKK